MSNALGRHHNANNSDFHKETPTTYPCRREIEIDMYVRTYFINLAHRKDRLDHITSELQHMPNVERVDAIRHDSGATGCYMSHLKALKLAQQNCHEHGVALIFEDDFQWNHNKEVGSKCMRDVLFRMQRKETWDVLLLACNPNSWCKTYTQIHTTWT